MSDRPISPLTAFVQVMASVERGKRSSAMLPVLKILTVAAAAFALVAHSNAPAWALGLAGGIFGSVCLVGLTVSIYLLVKNPDCMRSESFVLAREAMHRGYTGDSVLGLARSESSEASPPKMLVNDKSSEP